MPYHGGTVSSLRAHTPTVSRMYTRTHARARAGTKTWKACVPTQELAKRYGFTKQKLSDSELCQLQEMAKGSLGGCTFNLRGYT